MNVLVFGDSHVAALYKGQKSIVSDDQWPVDVKMNIRPLGGGHLTREPFFVDRGGYAELTTPEFRRQFERLPETDACDELYGISAPLHSVRVWRNPYWQKFAPAGSHLAGVPVADSMVKRIVLNDQKYVLELIKILLRNGKFVFAIEPPHPFRHHFAFRKISPQLGLYLNAVYRNTMRQELDTLGVSVVSVPDDCVEAGFMRDEYAQENDPHHGNDRYGRLMIERVLAFLRGSAEAKKAALLQRPNRSIASGAPAADQTRAPKRHRSAAGATGEEAPRKGVSPTAIKDESMTLIETTTQPKTPEIQAKIIEEFATLARLHNVKGPVLEIGRGPRTKAISLASFLGGQERHVLTRGESGDLNGVTFHKGDPNDMSPLFGDASFNAVLWDRAIDYDAAFWRTLAEIKRVLRPGGVLLVCARSFGKSNKFGVRITGAKGNELSFLTATAAPNSAGSDFWRISPQGMRGSILKDFDVREVRVAFMTPHLFGAGVKPTEGS